MPLCEEVLKETYVTCRTSPCSADSGHNSLNIPIQKGTLLRIMERARAILTNYIVQLHNIRTRTGRRPRLYGTKWQQKADIHVIVWQGLYCSDYVFGQNALLFLSADAVHTFFFGGQT